MMIGLTTFTSAAEFTDRQSGEKFADLGHASMVWSKEGDRWKIIHEHVSSPVRTAS